MESVFGERVLRVTVLCNAERKRQRECHARGGRLRPVEMSPLD